MAWTERFFRLDGLGNTQNGFQSQRGQVRHGKKVDLKTIGVTVVNCRSCVGKIPELQALIECTEAQIVIGSESCLTPEINSAEIFSKGQMVFRKDRINKTGGGVFIAVTNGLSCNEIEADTSCELVWVEVIPWIFLSAP